MIRRALWHVLPDLRPVKSSEFYLVPGQLVLPRKVALVYVQVAQNPRSGSHRAGGEGGLRWALVALWRLYIIHEHANNCLF